MKNVGAVRALVMKLVEGPTLAERMAQGAMPIHEALPIHRQITETLEAATLKGARRADATPTN